MPLDKVVVPGGGQNDLWHNLNFKGRYAGEIRIELTYYDTRPKEETLGAQQQESLSNGREHRERDSIGGPRQPKTVKRRPLPPDPTDSSPLRPILPDHPQSSPLPYTTSSGYEHTTGPQPQPVHRSMDHDPISRPTVDTGSQYNQVRGLPSLPNGSSYGVYEGKGTGAVSPAAMQPPVSQNEVFDNDETNGYVPNNMLEGRDGLYHDGCLRDVSPYGANHQEYDHYPTRASHMESYQDIGLPELPPYNSRRARPSVQPLSDHNAYGNSHSSPGPSMPTTYSLPDFRERSYQAIGQVAHGSDPPRDNSYEESPLRHCSVEPPYTTRQSPQQATITSDGAPPPPPAHRESGSRSQAHSAEQRYTENYGQVPAPAPLKIRTMRGSASASPLSQVQSNQCHHADLPPVSPLSSQPFSYSGASVSSQTSFSQPTRRQSQDPTLPSPLREHGMVMPPSLVPGYDPGIAEEESERIIHEKRMSARQRTSIGPTFSTSQHPPQYDSQPRPHASSWQAPPQSFVSSEEAQGRGAHHSSAPIIKPRVLSPDPRTPVRKSVSPQPGSAPQEARPTSMPFSPDSYDTFNPKVSSASSSINQLRPKYKTPEQAKEAAFQAQREVQRDEGPIISADGRVIDPSDHLPADTWAPEPERKTPRKGPEVTLRFRHSPQGAQPMPPAGRRPPRDTTIHPQPVSTPTYASSPVGSFSPVSAASASRNRLQKKSRGSPAQPNSSPIIPTLNTTTTPRYSLPRTSASEYPLREHENYGYNYSPTYARSSPIGPPPIPAKVPLAMGQEDYGMSTLSEEISRIDIGVSGGGVGRTRKSRFGP